jgi:hypothetical protein
LTHSLGTQQEETSNTLKYMTTYIGLYIEYWNLKLEAQQFPSTILNIRWWQNYWAYGLYPLSGVSFSLLNTGRWIKSISPIVLYSIYHRQNHFKTIWWWWSMSVKTSSAIYRSI